MTPREFRQEQNLEFDHFQELTETGIKPNHVNIELFAHEYHQAKLKLLGIGFVVGQSEPFKCEKCGSNWGEIRATCFSCNHESGDLST
jgi:hypothetical protein